MKRVRRRVRRGAMRSGTRRVPEHGATFVPAAAIVLALVICIALGRLLPAMAR